MRIIVLIRTLDSHGHFCDEIHFFVPSMLFVFSVLLGTSIMLTASKTVIKSVAGS